MPESQSESGAARGKETASDRNLQWHKQNTAVGMIYIDSKVSFSAELE